MSLKRVNFNMNSECHALLKSVCALKGVSVSDHCYRLIAADFKKDVYENKQVRNLFMRGTYKKGTNAWKLKEVVQEDFPDE